MAAKPDAAVAKPDAAVQVAMVADAGVKTADHTKSVDHTKTGDTTKTTHTKTVDHTKTTETKKPDETETIEQMFSKVQFARRHRLRDEHEVQPTRLETCALAACNVKDTALAGRWLRHRPCRARWRHHEVQGARARPRRLTPSYAQ